jgi:CubicO group peptidase (beta-lactamase class C family)
LEERRKIKLIPGLIKTWSLSITILKIIATACNVITINILPTFISNIFYMKPILLITLLVFTLTSFTQPLLKETNPNLASMSAERLQRLDKMLQEYVDKKWVSGGTAIIAREGKIVYFKGFGKDGTKPYEKDAIYRIASQTKAITSVAVMMLYEEGKLQLNDPISRYITEFSQPKVIDKFNEKDSTFTTIPAQREITITDLLTHTSGIGYPQIGSPIAKALYAKYDIIGGIGINNLLLADKMKKLGTLPLLHQPGEHWTYGLNIDVLGYLVEVISGMSLDVFLKKNLFEPIGMNDTYFYLPKEKYKRLVPVYTEDSTGKVELMKDMGFGENYTANYPAAPGTYFSGGGGLSSTALDYAIFMQMLLNGGIYNGRRILSPTTIKLMTTNHYDKIYTEWPEKTIGLGFGLFDERSYKNNPVSVGSYEWGGMFSSSYWIDPKEKLVGQLFLNQLPNSHGEIHDKFKILTYAAIEKSFQ